MVGVKFSDEAKETNVAKPSEALKQLIREPYNRKAIDAKATKNDN